MAEQKTNEEAKPLRKDTSFWGNLSLGQKIIFVLGIVSFVVLIFNFVLGGINSFWEFVVFILIGLVIAVVLYLVLWAVDRNYQKKYYSPKDDILTRFINQAIDYCPNNINNLYFTGTENKKWVYAGKIVGCLSIPYLIGEPELNEKKEQVYKTIPYRGRVPVFKSMRLGKDGDTFFVYERPGGLFGLFPKRHYLRCNSNLHDSLHGDVGVKTLNALSFGGIIEYPFEQYQSNAARILVQSQLEVILAAHEHQSDLISQGVDAAIDYNPFFKMLRQQNVEVANRGE